MSSLEKLISAHSSLGIYSITEESNVYCELGAYAVGLDLLCDELEQMLAEGFYSTAEDYGLTRSERLWGASREDLTTSKRRRMLLARSSFGFDDFTPEGIEQLLSFLGISAQVEEYPAVYRITVTVADKDLTQGKRNWIVSQLQALFPAHLEVDAVFYGFNWSDIEEKNLTFAQMETADMSWSQIDIYCIN